MSLRVKAPHAARVIIAVRVRAMSLFFTRRSHRRPLLFPETCPCQAGPSADLMLATLRKRAVNVESETPRFGLSGTNHKTQQTPRRLTKARLEGKMRSSAESSPDVNDQETPRIKLPRVLYGVSTLTFRQSRGSCTEARVHDYQEHDKERGQRPRAGSRRVLRSTATWEPRNGTTSKTSSALEQAAELAVIDPPPPGSRHHKSQELPFRPRVRFPAYH